MSIYECQVKQSIQSNEGEEAGDERRPYIVNFVSPGTDASLSMKAAPESLREWGKGPFGCAAGSEIMIALGKTPFMRFANT
jgi:hypothetical protein